MERRPESARIPAEREEHPAAKETPESTREHVETEKEAFDRDRVEVLKGERDQLAQDYTILRDTLLEMREKGADDQESKEEYERVRSQYLSQIVELHARGDLSSTKDINAEGIKAMLEGARGEQGKATTLFELGIQRIVQKVSANKDFNARFDMLIQHRSEGEEALPFLEKLMPEIYTKTAKAEVQKATQLSPEANAPKEKKDTREALHEAFDDIKGMLDEDRARQTRSPRRKGGRPHGIRKPGLMDRLRGVFGGKRKSG